MKNRKTHNIANVPPAGAARRPFGSTGREVATIGQGTWSIENNPGGATAAIATLRRGLDLGMTHIDTAEMYGSGASEKIVGEAIAGRRDELFLVSKVLPHHASRKETVTACDHSLARLNTDRMDCYLLHWRGATPLEETIEAFEQLKTQGKILSWGVSNFDEADLEEAWNIANEGALACNQVLYHLKERAIEHSVLPWCEKHDVTVVAYSPYGHGQFPGLRTAGGRILEQIGAAHNATSRQVALRFLTRRPSLFAIPKASSIEHAADNAGAMQFELTETEVEQIETAFPVGPQPRSLPML